LFPKVKSKFLSYVSEAERSERNTFAERLSAVEAIANAISVVSSNGPGNRAGSSNSRR
jgi:E3 ubiquitin-protein ligase EDD1